MNIVNQKHKILTPLDREAIYKLIEKAGRVCYKSEDKITTDSAEKFIEMVRSRGHESVLEHCVFTVKFLTDRGVTHELVRHRLVSYSQESTRYCNYSKKGMTFVRPVFWGDSPPKMAIWEGQMMACEATYNLLVGRGAATPQEARCLLPNSLKTEIVCTTNVREWRHILKLRTSKAAHPQIRCLMLPLLKELQEVLPVLFEDIIPYRTELCT